MYTLTMHVQSYLLCFARMFVEYLNATQFLLTLISSLSLCIQLVGQHELYDIAEAAEEMRYVLRFVVLLVSDSSEWTGVRFCIHTR